MHKKFWSENLWEEPRRIPRHRWEDNVGKDMREIACEDVD
jgi:hypothetical protein